MRNFKKIISLVCVIAMLMSVCAVVVSAETKVTVTMNNSGTVVTENLVVGADMPTQPDNDLGEKFMGWYTDYVNWTESSRVAKVPSSDVTVYARYRSLTINFSQDMATSMNQQKGKYLNKWGTSVNIVDGALEVKPWSNVHGIVIPAYDTENITPFVMKRDGSYTIRFYIKAQMKTGVKTPLRMGVFYVDTGVLFSSGIHNNAWNGRVGVNVNPSDTFVEYKVNLPANDMVGGRWFDSLIFATRDGQNTTTDGASDNYVLYIDKIIITNQYESINGDIDMGGDGSIAVRYNTNGLITTVYQDPGDPVIDGIGYAGLKFLGWTSDSALENVITTVPADTDNDGEVVIYGKYNYRMFNANGPVSESTDTPGKRVNIESDPNSDTNLVVGISGSAAAYGFALPNYDRYSDGNFKLKPNTKYFVQYKAKSSMDVFSRNGTIVARGDSAGVATSTPDKKDEIDASRSMTVINEDLLGNINKGVWKTVTVVFETPESLVNEETGKVEDQLYIYGGGVNLQWETNKVYIDEVIYGEYNETETDSSAAINFATNGPVYESIVGAAGDIFTMPPDPLNPGYNFLGWYTDKDFTTPFVVDKYGRDTIPEGGLDLYAKWEVTTDTVTFSNIPIQYQTSGAFQKGAVIEGSDPPTKHTAFAIIKEPGNDTNDVLHYDPVLYNSDQTTSGTVRACLIFPSTNFMRVRDGEQYVLKFRYKVVGYAGPSVKVGAYTNGTDVWVGHVKQYESDLDLVTADAITTDWVPAEFKFTANVDESNLLEYCNVSVAISGGASVYLDDFTLEAVNDGVNIYESTIEFETNGGKPIAHLKGVKYTPVTLPTPEKENYTFNGWFADAELTQPVTELNYPNYGTTIKLYAQWMFNKLTEGFEEFPAKVKNRGFSSAYSLYNKEEAGRNFDAANVHSGNESVFRDGSKRQDSSFVMVRDEEYKIVKGKTYTVSFWVKPTNVTKQDGVIGLATFEKLTNVSKPVDNIRVAKMSDLVLGEWNKITYTFTATNDKATYFGIYTDRGNDMYFDDCEVLLGDQGLGHKIENSGGSSTIDKDGAPLTGDNSINPMFVALAVIIAVGALLVIGKKVFVK